MSYDATYEGQIFIRPALTYADLKRAFPQDSWRKIHNVQSLLEVSEHNEQYALALRIEEEQVEQEDGLLIRKSASIIDVMTVGPTDDNAQSYLSKIAEMFPDHLFNGHIECVGEDGKIWRLAIENGECIRIEPQIVWPD